MIDFFKSPLTPKAESKVPVSFCNAFNKNIGLQNKSMKFFWLLKLSLPIFSCSKLMSSFLQHFGGIIKSILDQWPRKTIFFSFSFSVCNWLVHILSLYTIFSLFWWVFKIYFFNCRVKKFFFLYINIYTYNCTQKIFLSHGLICLTLKKGQLLKKATLIIH